MFSLIVAVTALLIPTLTQGCGNRPAGMRVVGGVDAQPHSWPWQISLRVNGRHICGGSLIRPDWVVTAAHCVDRNKSPSGYTVVVGAHVRTGSTAVQQTFNLKQLFSHESFSMQHLRNDIALLQLDRPATLSSKVNTVCLPTKGSKVAPGTRCFITGWGRTIGGGAAASTLQQAELPVVEHSKCARTNGRLAPVDETTMVCAGSGIAGQAGGCQGDSGGPFVCKENGNWVLRGAVSWGNGMCTTDYFTVFARVSNFIDWINQKMSGSGGSAGSGGGSACADSSPHCPYVAQYCSYPQIRNQCLKSCGACGGGGGGPSCSDSNKNCPILKSYCSFHKYVQLKCKRTCNLC